LIALAGAIGAPAALFAAAIVVVARRFLPGDGGHPPIDGLSTAPTPVRNALGVVVAATGTLAFGAVLGPEMPVIALGSVVGVAATDLARVGGRDAALISSAGSFSAVSALFGGPIVAGILLTEAGVGMGSALIPALLPGFVAAAVGYLIFVGFGDWGGLDAPGLTIPDLPLYQGAHVDDLVFAIVVGALTALVLRLVHRLAPRVDELRHRLGMPALLLAGGLAVGVCAQVADWLGADSQDVLFSGQSSIEVLVAEDSAKVLLILLIAKLLAYVVSLGCGFRGGPIFPAIFVGITLASFGTVWFDTSPTFAIAIGAAAGMATQTRLIVAALLFAGLLVGLAGIDAIPGAVLATAAAWLTSTALDRRFALA
jgi:H+/Cl- antiporter ClcA